MNLWSFANVSLRQSFPRVYECLTTIVPCHKEYTCQVHLSKLQMLNKNTLGVKKVRGQEEAAL